MTIDVMMILREELTGTRCCRKSRLFKRRPLVLLEQLTGLVGGGPLCHIAEHSKIHRAGIVPGLLLERPSRD